MGDALRYSEEGMNLRIPVLDISSVVKGEENIDELAADLNRVMQDTGSFMIPERVCFLENL